MKTVAVLGCGPTGLIAAHAVGLTGSPMSIHSIPMKSEPSGAQFLHRGIPGGLCSREPDLTIRHIVKGSSEEYRRKVYGNRDVPFVSFDNVYDGMTVPAWSLTRAYDRLWDWFGDSINEANISAEWIEKNASQFELIVSSVPAPAICCKPSEHHFYSQAVTIAPNGFGTLDLSLRNAGAEDGEDVIFYNGEKSPSWYRASRIDGFGGYEYGAGNPLPPLPADDEGLVVVKKPLHTNCDCWPDIVRVGRYGKWKKGELVHHAFVDVMDAFGIGKGRDS